MSDRFTEALRHLGHIYEPRPEVVTAGRNARHIAKVFLPTGEIKAICGIEIDEHQQLLGCPQLWLDVNCESCRKIEGLAPSALTKRTLMIDTVNILCDIEQMFLDAMHWNFHNAEGEPINPDPDGVLATAWIENRLQLLSMLARFEPTMTKHEGRFNWPSDLDTSG